MRNIFRKFATVFVAIALIIACIIAVMMPSSVTISAKLDSAVLEDAVTRTIDGVVHIRNVTMGWQGSGFAVKDNIVVTARHVVEYGQEFIITTNDGNEYIATSALSSKKSDVGFILLDVPVLTPMTMGSVKECRVGQFLYAIGSPLGIINRNSVTFGIISALNRDLDTGYDIKYGWEVLFQTDTAGHPGNSGCPIFTLDGVVRGVLVAGMSNSLIYCVPVDVFMDDLPTAIQWFELNKYEFEQAPNINDNEYPYVEIRRK